MLFHFEIHWCSPRTPGNRGCVRERERMCVCVRERIGPRRIYAVQVHDLASASQSVRKRKRKREKRENTLSACVTVINTEREKVLARARERAKTPLALLLILVARFTLTRLDTRLR